MNDKLELVHCNCGGEAEVFHIAPEGYEGSYCVRCTECLIQTPFFNKDKDKAIEVWNRAMGERTAKVYKKQAPDRLYYFYCGACGEMIDCSFYEDYKSIKSYCGYCGAKLDWSE